MGKNNFYTKKNRILNNIFHPINFDIKSIQTLKMNKTILNLPCYKTKFVIILIIITILFEINYLYIQNYILFNINSNYETVDPNDSEYTYVPIVATNDIHGHFFPVINQIKDGNKKIKYKVGGLKYISKYINILRNEFGKNRVLYFDSGDSYFGSTESFFTNGEIMIDYYNLLEVDALTLGNHEYLYTRKWVQNKNNKIKSKILVNNIKDKITGAKNRILGHNQKGSHIFKIKLNNDDIIKIGVIGLTLNMRKDKPIYDVGNRETWDNITYTDYLDGLEEEANKLRNKGANAVIILSHIGFICKNHNETYTLNMYNKASIQKTCDVDDSRSLIKNIIENIKPGVIDAIIGGDTHNEVHHWYKNIPIIMTASNSQFLNIMYLPFKKDIDGKYILVNDEIKIEGPLPSCEKIFKNSKNCVNIKSEEYKKYGKLINYAWHGKKIESDPIVKPIYEKYYSNYIKLGEKEIAKFTGFKRKISVDHSGKSLLGNLFADSIKNITKADFVIMNPQTFLFYFFPGKVTLADFYRMIPYGNKLCTTEVTGAELIAIIKTVQVGRNSFHPSSGLKQTIKITSSGHKKEVIDVQIYINGNATKIDENKTYIMGSNSFILSEESGNDFTSESSLNIINQKFKNHQIKCSKITMKKELAHYFHQKGTVDLSKDIDTKPRIVIIKENGEINHT